MGLLSKLRIALLITAISLIVPAPLIANSNSDLTKNVDRLKVRVKVYYPREGRDSHLATSCDPTSSDPTTYGTTGWFLDPTVHYSINTSNAPSSVRSNFQAIVANSFQTWSDSSGSQVNFIYDGKTSGSRARLDFKNTVVWGRTSSNALATTYIWYYADTGEVADVDTVFNKRFAWGWTNPATVDEDVVCGPLGNYDVQNVLVHELGHWMGLDDRYDSTEKDLTMFGYASPGELKKNTLTSGDKAGILAIYNP